MPLVLFTYEVVVIRHIISSYIDWTIAGLTRDEIVQAISDVGEDIKKFELDAFVEKCKQLGIGASA